MGLEEKLPSGVLLTTVEGVAGYMRKEAEESLPAGHTLELTIVDIKRAGQYEP